MKLNDYGEMAFDQFGSIAIRLLPYFDNFRPLLNKANLKISLPEYISLLIAAGFLTFFSILSLLGTIFFIGSGMSGLLNAFIIGLIAAVLAVGFGAIYPYIAINERSAQIRDTLPFAAMYMSTLAGTGSSISEIFLNLSKVEEYGEVAEEAKKISRDIETFGMDLNEALKRGSERTPSEDWEELLRGLNHVITTGGSVREFLEQRSATLMDDYERRIEKFSDQLGLLVEMYITLVIVGSIIFTSMSAVMSSFTGFAPDAIVAAQAVAIFLGLPIISGMFVFLIRGISPGGIM